MDKNLEHRLRNLLQETNDDMVALRKSIESEKNKKTGVFEKLDEHDEKTQAADKRVHQALRENDPLLNTVESFIEEMKELKNTLDATTATLPGEGVFTGNGSETSNKDLPQDIDDK